MSRRETRRWITLHTHTHTPSAGGYLDCLSREGREGPCLSVAGVSTEGLYQFELDGPEGNVMSLYAAGMKGTQGWRRITYYVIEEEVIADDRDRLEEADA